MIFSLNSAVVRPSYLLELIGAAVAGEAFLRRRGLRRRSVGLTASPGSTTGDDVEIELLGEFEIALVVRRDGHDGAGAVADQHVVGDPDWDRLAVDGIDRVGAGEDAGLVFGELSAIEIALAGGGFAILLDLGGRCSAS